MYQIREVVLCRGEDKIKRPVIEFTVPDQAILGEFLMTDAPMFAGGILQEIDAVILGERAKMIGSGNRCGWEIDADQTVINDLFADMGDDVPSMPTCTFETQNLAELVDIWLMKRKENEDK